MFGYVKPFKPELKICEFEAYKAVYCGLCGQLGKSFGALARLTLSYDFTFLSMLHCAMTGEALPIESRRCYVNPLIKRPMCGEGEALRFSADTAAIMIYYKLLDNIKDGGAFQKLGWSLLRPFAAAARGKASKAIPVIDELVRESVERQAAVEAAASASLDEAAEPTAFAMAGICGLLSDDERHKRVLERLGYFIGRFVYLCDALDDLEADLKNGGYNPLILRYGISGVDSGKLTDARTAAKESLYMTIGEAARAYDLLEPLKFGPVLDNIIALGMRGNVDDIMKKKERHK